MAKDKKDRISEGNLLKALAELESVAKGDPLEEQDPEGGLSTEGEPLSDAAPRGRGEQTRKSRARSSTSSPLESASSSSDGESPDDDDDASSDASSSPPPSMRKKKGMKGKEMMSKKVSKAAMGRRRSESMDSGSDDGSSDDGSDEAEKSFREMADGDETMSKGILVNEFLESMTDQLSLALLHVKGSISKSIAEMEARLIDHIEVSLNKSMAQRREFDVRLAKAVASIGKTIQGDLPSIVDMVKSLADQPVGSPRGKAVLSKGEVNRPPWSGPTSGDDDRRLADGSDGDYVEELRGIGTKAINDWLFRKSAANQLDQNVIMAFEADRYDPAMLPPAIRKALADDLIK